MSKGGELNHVEPCRVTGVPEEPEGRFDEEQVEEVTAQTFLELRNKSARICRGLKSPNLNRPKLKSSETLSSQKDASQRQRKRRSSKIEEGTDKDKIHGISSERLHPMEENVGLREPTNEHLIKNTLVS